MRRRRRRRASALQVLVRIGFVLSALLLGNPQPTHPNLAAQAAAPAREGEYLGGEACLHCHDIRDAFAKNPHYKNWAEEKLAWSERGCEPCHGPGSEHGHSGGDPKKILNPRTAGPARINDTCLTCHQQQEERAHYLRSSHGLNAVACTTCHTIHTPRIKPSLLAARPPALCYACHEEVRADFNQPFRHKVNEGWMSCTDCHNPHGGFAPHETRESTGPEAVCFDCHADKQGPFVFEHLPVRVEGCGICHDVHGSTNPRMLKRSEIRFLCLECHADTPGVFGPTTPLFHDITQARWQHCTDCHVNIHGSQVSRVFFE